MKKTITLFAALLIIAGLCAGCKKEDNSEPEAVAQPKESSAKKWEPETAKPPQEHNEHDGHDHSGHNH